MENNIKKQVILNPYNEVYGILLAFGNDFIDKVPDEILKKITNNMTYIIKDDQKKYNIPTYNLKVSLNLQGVSKDALAIIYYIYYNYWCVTENEKKYLKKLIENNKTKVEESKKEKYSNANLFIKKNKVEDKVENLSIIVKEKKWYQEIFMKFFEFFK